MADTVAPDRALKLVSWNVNGLRAVMRKDPSFLQIFSQLDADVFAIQETKLQEGQVELDLPGYFQTWNFAERKGYSGTAVFSREDPLRVIRQIGSDVADDEGRVCALEFPTFWFVDVYTPNSKQGLARIEERMGWDNVGWRIDYFLTSERVADRIEGASIHDEVFGSDHCPIELQIRL